LLPLTMDGQRLPVRQAPPALGEQADALLQELGYGTTEIAALRQAEVVGAVPG
jgi:crotonobetainyl-CoA:carnitine CoA-transferase CaiB-like acyl-CoA transferase